MPFLRPEKRTPFRLPFGVFPKGWPAGGVTDQLEEGYTVVPERDSPYKYQVLINVSNERLFGVFESLAALVTGDSSSAIEVQGKDDVVSMYTSGTAPRDRVLAKFREHAFQLANDGFTGFGIASAEMEVFVEHHKGLRLCCVSTSEAKRSLTTLGISQRKNLTTLSTLPHLHADLPIFFLHELGEVQEKLPFTVTRLPPSELDMYLQNRASYEDFRREIVSALEMTIIRQAYGSAMGGPPRGGTSSPARP